MKTYLLTTTDGLLYLDAKSKKDVINVFELFKNDEVGENIDKNAKILSIDEV